MDQIVGSPSHMRYAEPQVRSDARKVVVHGYFQEIRYFHHHFPVLTSILFPPSLDAQARSAWSSRQPRMPQRTHTEAIQHLAVHVRFNHGGRLSTSYFQEAIRIAKEQLSIARMGCVFFTNEPKKLQRRWKTKVCGKDHATFNDLSLRDDVVLAVMAICCAGIVLSNSTF
ncbi:3-beta-glucosidase, partial [Durusdinium trenchii]